MNAKSKKRAKRLAAQQRKYKNKKQRDSVEVSRQKAFYVNMCR